MKNEQEKYEPEYPILDESMMLPRDLIQLVPEDRLDPLDRAELQNLRKNVGYKYIAADTPSNREAIAIKTAYYQIVAHKEGWHFDPENYQVNFVDPKHFLLSEPGTQRRILEFEEDTTLDGLSPEKRAGFVISDERDVRIGNEETDSLAKRILKHFWPKRYNS